ncbi:MAG TPA: TetR/AcrR family transcriptional regulator [Terracidiphilus sp.]|nr:TetR/AcrR family transcriptional regulator [Terracidiphilus sp.]
MARAEPYHHENLRQTLLEAAVALIGEVGPRAFTLREVARRAGVSHNAPYRHFPSKDDLLVAVAKEGFERLTAGMQKSLARGRTALEQLQLCGCGYVDFALRWPHHFLVMFDLPHEMHSECKGEAVGRNAFDVLMGCIVAAQGAGDLPAGDPLPLVWTAWSLVHGIAKLAVSGNLPLSHAATVAFARQATVVLSVGMMKDKPQAR